MTRRGDGAGRVGGERGEERALDAPSLGEAPEHHPSAHGRTIKGAAHLSGSGHRAARSTHGRVPLDWTGEHRMLGGSLWSSAELARWRELAQADLDRFVLSLRSSLARSDSCLDRLVPEVNYARGLHELGWRASSTVHLKQALEMRDKLLTSDELGLLALSLAFETPQTRGRVLRTLGERAREKDWLEQAVEAHRSEAQCAQSRNDQIEWAASQNELAESLQLLGKRVGSEVLLTNSAGASRAALSVFTSEWCRSTQP